MQRGYRASRASGRFANPRIRARRPGQRVDVAFPRPLRQNPLRMLVSCPPTRCYPGPREIDILCMVFAVQPRRQQTHEMHRRVTAIGRQLLHCRIIARRFGEPRAELANDMAQTMEWLLPSDMASAAAGILDVLLPAEHLPDGLGLRAVRLPHIDRKDQRAAPRLVVEYHLNGRVGIEA